MKNKVDKQKDFEAIKKALEESQNVFVSGFDKLTVAQDYELRKTVRAAGGRYRVLKNTLAEKASEGLPVAGAVTGLKGMNSIAYTSGDPVALAKALVGYAKANPTFTFKAGFVEGRVVEVQSINDLANMPSKEQIYAQLLYVINAPAQKLVTAINGVGRNLAVVVDQGVKENKFNQ
ncbi:50S ribosomal protein L10 [Bryobacter aggregatus]|uniref:50S ribosomal protein L10 n=1 Tax=Bryobacter aggregatus TaxID=360054 RepID=UPI0004E15292|nr:50S ribosomal protein L10 [Bryobacter aggregatus]